MERVCSRAARLAALAVALAVALSSSACGDTWLSDSFNSYTGGSLAGQGGWTGSAGAVRVETTFVHGSTGKSIEANYLAWGGGDVTRAVNSGTGGQGHYIDFDAASDIQGPSPAGENLGFLKIFGTNGLEITRFYYAYQQFKALTSAGQQVIATGVPARAWYHVRIGLDLNAGLMDVWVNNTQVIAGTPVYSRSAGIGSIVFGQWNGLGTKFTRSETYLDNLSCRSFPVPGAVRVVSPICPWAGWEHNNVSYPFVLFDSATGTYTMYYSGSYACEINDSVWDQWATGYATSNDGANWNKPEDDYEPILYARRLLEGDLLDPETEAATFDSIMAFGPCVIKDGATWKMWYTGWNGESVHDSQGITTKINFRIGYATSADGINWTKQAGTAGAGSVLGLGSAGQPDSAGAGAPHVLKEGDSHRMWYEGFDGSAWRILYATSADGVNWTRQGVALGPGPAGARDALGARNPVVITRNGQYELWYQGRRAQAPNYQVLRATSPDGLTWTKALDAVTLHPDYPITDSEQVLVDSILVNPDGSCQAYFAKQITSSDAVAHGTMTVKRFHIYKEAVNP